VGVKPRSPKGRARQRAGLTHASASNTLSCQRETSRSKNPIDRNHGIYRNRTCPTWHGGVAYQPTAYNPVKQIAYGVGAEGCFSGNGRCRRVQRAGRRNRQGEI
jgi:hypothetical protein